MSKRHRRSFTSEQKASILKRHLVEGVAVSTLCEEYQIQPSQFYKWRGQLLDNLTSVLQASPEARGSSREKALEARVAQLEARLAKKDAIIAEISEEYVTLKKEVGEP